MEALLNEIISAPWLINPSSVHAYMPAISNIIKGTHKYSRKEQAKMRKDARMASRMQFRSAFDATKLGVEIDDCDDYDALNSLIQDVNAIISIDGPIMRTGGWCYKGCDDITEELRMVGEHVRVKGVVLKIHSPGGSVWGTELLAKFVADFEQKYNKPIVGLIQQQADSAAYWIASQCPYVIVNGNSAEAGCIGTMVTLYDYSGEMELLGIKEIVINATKSFNKNAEVKAALDGNESLMRTNILDPLNEAFLSAVTKGRGSKLNTTDKENGVPLVLTGRTFYGPEIVKQGLADAMGDIEAALNYLDKRSKELGNAIIPPTTIISSTKTESMSVKSKFFAMLQAAGFAMSKDGKEVSASELEAALPDADFEAAMNTEAFEAAFVTALESDRFKQAVLGLIPTASTAETLTVEAIDGVVADKIKALSESIESLTAKTKETAEAVAGLMTGKSGGSKPSNGTIEADAASEDGQLDETAMASVRLAKQMLDRGQINQSKYESMVESAKKASAERSKK